MYDRQPWGTIAVGMRCTDAIPAPTVASLQGLLVGGLRPGDAVLPLQHRNYHHVAANEIAGRFLSSTRCDSLLYIDADQTFAPDTLSRLRDNKHGQRYDVLGALYVHRKTGEPHAYTFSHSEAGTPVYDRLTKWEPGHVVTVDALGLGFTLVRRSTLEALPAPWFYHKTPETGEDLTFFFDVRRADMRVGLATGVRVGHLDTIERWHGEVG